MSYAIVLEALLGHESKSLSDDVLNWLPDAIFQAYREEKGISDICRHTPQAAYWDGARFELRPWPTEQAAWIEDYRALADKVLSQAENATTIIDVGSGLSALSCVIALRAQEKGLSGLKFVNIDRDADGVRFGEEMARRHNIDIKHYCLDFAEEVQRGTPYLRLGNGRKLVVTRSGIFPWYNQTQLTALFEYLIKQACVEAGFHWDLTGFRTQSYRDVVETLPGKLPPSKHPSNAPDPLEYLSLNAYRLGIRITEHLEIWPHYQGLRVPGLVHWPSYLAWERKGP